MDISPRKPLKRPSEPVDNWLHNEGYFRKLAPRDPTCLFRAISEQIYSTQHYHIRVRRECVEFMRKNHHLFEQTISIPFESYLEQMSCFTEWGGINEIQAMSLLYEREFLIFDGQNMAAKVATENDFKDTIYLCHTPPKQYESVYARDFIATAAYCQSVIYQTLYKDVFMIPNIDDTVQKMLHERAPNVRHDNFFNKGTVDIREELTAELESKIEKELENGVEERASVRVFTPFPYRVAKALDPNIYRNTDFDIWHEIRREVRNFGWTRWNSTELQVGGKCLVQVDYKGSEFVEKNNNCPQTNGGGKDSNGNTSKITENSSGKRESTLLHGHIQEMSKDEGPVVVFIEELGEKKTLPYAALKPITPKRNRQNNNWTLATPCRRNTTYDTNQKWKRTWHSTNRKSKDSANGSKNPVDGNNNRNENDADVKTKDKEKIESWDDKTRNENENSGLKAYTMETYNSCQGFAMENSIDVRPVTVLLDNAPSTPRASSVPKNTEDPSKNSSQTAKVPGNNDNPERGSPNVGSVAPETMIQPIQQISLHSPSETFYMSPTGIPLIFPMNANMVCGSPDGNPYSFPFPCATGEPPAPGSLLDRTLRAISFNAPPSIDPNGSDLPYADTVTLRFFYNLGLEYFRAAHEWAYGPGGQPMNIPSNYMPQGNVLPPNTPIEGNMQQASVANDDENSRPINVPRQNYGPRRRNENPSNGGKTNNGQQQIMKTFSNRKNDCQDYSHAPRNDSVIKPNGDMHRYQTNLNNDRMKDHPIVRKNGPTSRYKKNMDGRNRNVPPSDSYHQEYQQPRQNYQSNPVNAESPPFQATKNETAQQGNIPQNLQSPVQSPQTGGNHAAYQTPYGPQHVYAAMPYYPSEAETFYAHGPGFYPIPYMAHPEIGDGNSVNSCPPQVYPAGTENYAQPIFPPYVYPQQAIFPGLPPQNGQENWYPMPGQPQYMQYSPIQPSQHAPSNINGPAPSP